MPTAARLTAAICLAAVAAMLSFMIMPLLPELTDFGYFVPVNIGLGLCLGWILIGPRAGGGVAAALNNGFSGVTVLVVAGILVQAIYEMLRRAARLRYDDTGEAIVSALEISLEYAALIATPQIIGAALAGSAITGLFVGLADRKWP